MKSHICPTCGGEIEEGRCEYCGRSYKISNSELEDVRRLGYASRDGEREAELLTEREKARQRRKGEMDAEREEELERWRLKQEAKGAAERLLRKQEAEAEKQRQREAEARRQRRIASAICNIPILNVLFVLVHFGAAFFTCLTGLILTIPLHFWLVSSEGIDLIPPQKRTWWNSFLGTGSSIALGVAGAIAIVVAMGLLGATQAPATPVPSEVPSVPLYGEPLIPPGTLITLRLHFSAINNDIVGFEPLGTACPKGETDVKCKFLGRDPTGYAEFRVPLKNGSRIIRLSRTQLLPSTAAKIWPPTCAKVLPPKDSPKQLDKW